ncbi:MAG: carbohydrate-binding protein [Chitinivibrionales bacterium]|nr:carbohydrate-binding protein [Chitinivibrionales bacterium]
MIIYTIGKPSDDKRWDNHCMGAISKSGNLFNACHASHAKTAIIEFDNAPPSCSDDGSCPGNLGVTPYRVLEKRGGNFEMHRFSQCNEDFIMWVEGSKGYVVRVSNGATIMGPMRDFTPQDYYDGDFATSGPTVYLETPSNNSSWQPGVSVPVAAQVTGGSTDIEQVTFTVDGSTIATKTSSPWETAWTASGEGAHEVAVVVENKAGETAEDKATITVAGLYAYPDSIPHAVPGRIECEHFDFGGEGIAYHDESAGNSKTSYRSDEDVDVDNGGTGMIVSATRGGEWLKYSVTVAKEQAYTITVAAANGSIEGSFHVAIDGEDITGPLSGSTGSYDTWKEFAKGNIVIPAGEHVLSLAFDQTGHIVDYIEISPPDDPITLLAPIGGETFSVGEELVIEWSTIISVVDEVYVEYSSNAGIDFVDLSALKFNESVDFNHPEWGRFTYTITPDMASTEAVVRVRKYGSGTAALSQIFTVLNDATAGFPDQDRKTGNRAVILLRKDNSIHVQGAAAVSLYALDGRLVARQRGENSPVLVKNNTLGVTIVGAEKDDGSILYRLITTP